MCGSLVSFVYNYAALIGVNSTEVMIVFGVCSIAVAILCPCQYMPNNAL